MDRAIYTIGHSNHSPGRLVWLLAEASIDALVDVRSNPTSAWAPCGSPHVLKQILEAANIRYVYLGGALGGRPDDPDCHDSLTGKVDYEAIGNKDSFKQALNQVLEEAKAHRVCVMCAEEDPSACHRDLLVGESLRARGVRVLHIRGTGQIQTDEDLRKEKARVPANQLSWPL